MISAKVKLISVLALVSVTFACCSAPLDTSIANDAKTDKTNKDEAANIYFDRVIAQLLNSVINSPPENKLMHKILMSAILQRITQMIQEQRMVSDESLRQDQD